MTLELVRLLVLLKSDILCLKREEKYHRMQFLMWCRRLWPTFFYFFFFFLTWISLIALGQSGLDFSSETCAHLTLHGYSLYVLFRIDAEGKKYFASWCRIVISYSYYLLCIRLSLKSMRRVLLCVVWVLPLPRFLFYADNLWCNWLWTHECEDYMTYYKTCIYSTQSD